MTSSDSIDSFSEDIAVPDDFICPLSLSIMKDPVISRYGNSFERSEILAWLSKHSTDPLTRRPLRLRDLISDYRLQARIRHWQTEHEQDVVVTCRVEDDDDENVCFGYIDYSQFVLGKLTDVTERTEEDLSGVEDENHVITEATVPAVATPRRRRRGLRAHMRQILGRSSRA